MKCKPVHRKVFIYAANSEGTYYSYDNKLQGEKGTPCVVLALANGAPFFSQRCRTGSVMPGVLRINLHTSYTLCCGSTTSLSAAAYRTPFRQPLKNPADLSQMISRATVRKRSVQRPLFAQKTPLSWFRGFETPLTYK